MHINISKIPTYYINLEEHTNNKISIEQMLRSKGFCNINRTPGIKISGYEGMAYYQKINHYMGVGMAQINAMRNIKNSLPALILEDDVKFTEYFQTEIEIPNNTDAIYLGVSCVGNAYGKDLKNGFARIFNVLAAHAIIYINPEFLNKCHDMAKESIIDNMMPFDLKQSELLCSYNVITPINPFFYQSNDRQSANKWEDLTNKSLRIYG